MQNAINIPTGEIKTFGAYGISYQVGETDQVLPDGDVLVSITLIQTSEKEKYKLSKLILDPKGVT